MTQTHTTYLSLGSNIPDRAANLSRAVNCIAESVGTVTKQSPIYETQSWGYSDEDYLNQTIEVETALTPFQLLKTINAIESALGRIRSGKGYEARTIDIDILFYDNEILDTPQLTIPHPKIALRRFVLTPLCDIAPEFLHPVIRKKAKELLKNCTDTLNVKLFQK